MSGYGSFAFYYDRLTENVDYKGMALAVERYADRFGAEHGVLLDLACGTGSLCEELARLGYDVIGVDSSDQMLGAALDKKFDSGLPIQYLRQEMTELDMYGTIDVTVCTLDSLNHLPDTEALKRVFGRVSLFAYPEGLFIFDVNTLHKHRDILAQNAYTYDMGDFFCAWQNQYNETDGSVDIFLDIFDKREDGSYDRISESFTERVWPDEELCELLDGAGFDVFAKYDGYTDEPLREGSERAVYVTKRRDSHPLK